MGSNFSENCMDIYQLDQLISYLLSKQEGKIQVILKDETIKESIIGFLKMNGYTYQLKDSHFETIVDIQLQSLNALGELQMQKRPLIFDQVIVVASLQFGEGDKAYSEALMKSMIIAWVEREPLPSKIIFINSGVKLLGQESKLVDVLRRVQSQGVEIYASTSCLAQYRIERPFDCVEGKTLFQLAQLMKNTKNTIRL